MSSKVSRRRTPEHGDVLAMRRGDAIPGRPILNPQDAVVELYGARVRAEPGHDWLGRPAAVVAVSCDRMAGDAPLVVRQVVLDHHAGNPALRVQGIGGVTVQLVEADHHHRLSDGSNWYGLSDVACPLCAADGAAVTNQAPDFLLTAHGLIRRAEEQVAACICTDGANGAALDAVLSTLADLRAQVARLGLQRLVVAGGA